MGSVGRSVADPAVAERQAWARIAEEAAARQQRDALMRAQLQADQQAAMQGDARGQAQLAEQRRQFDLEQALNREQFGASREESALERALRAGEGQLGRASREGIALRSEQGATTRSQQGLDQRRILEEGRIAERAGDRASTADYRKTALEFDAADRATRAANVAAETARRAEQDRLTGVERERRGTVDADQAEWNRADLKLRRERQERQDAEQRRQFEVGAEAEAFRANTARAAAAREAPAEPGPDNVQIAIDSLRADLTSDDGTISDDGAFDKRVREEFIEIETQFGKNSDEGRRFWRQAEHIIRDSITPLGEAFSETINPRTGETQRTKASYPRETQDRRVGEIWTSIQEDRRWQELPTAPAAPPPPSLQEQQRRQILEQPPLRGPDDQSMAPNRQAELLRALLSFMPGGPGTFDAANRYGFVPGG